MFGWDRIAGTFCLIVGSSLLAGFFSQFRERGYVGWLGASFLALSAAAFMSQVTRQGSAIAMAVAAVFFVFAFFSAFMQTRNRLRNIKRRHQAAQEQLLAMVEAEQARRKKEAQSDNDENPAN